MGGGGMRGAYFVRYRDEQTDPKIIFYQLDHWSPKQKYKHIFFQIVSCIFLINQHFFEIECLANDVTLFSGRHILLPL
jgi:hypothetical protein